jgi:fibronectin-binding autotransporter adhesin
VSGNSGNITLSGSITGGGNVLTLGGTTGGTASSVLNTTVASLVKDGAGTWALSGANTYTSAAPTWLAASCAWTTPA